MLKLLKWLFITIGFVLSSTLAVLIYVTATLDPNDYREQIETAVKEQSNLELSLESIDWSLFPWLGLDIGATQLTTPDSGDLASLSQIKVQVKLLPLLSKQIEIGEIKVAGATIHVVQNSDGSLNWDALSSDHASSESEQKDEIDEKNASTPEINLSIDQLSIIDATLLYTDHKTVTQGKPLQYTLEKVNLTVKNLALNSQTLITEFPLQASLLFSDNLGAKIEPKLKVNIKADVNKQLFQLQQLHLTTKATLPDLPIPIVSTIKANIEAALQEERVNVNQLTVDINNLLALSGGVEAGQVLSSPTFNGSLTLAETDIQALMQALQIDIPETSSPEALKKVAFNMGFSGDAKQVSVKPFTVNIDHSKLTGSVAVTDFEKQAIQTNLSLDRFNVDNYLPPKTDAEQPPADTSSETASEAVADLLPIETLKGLNLDTRFSVGQLQASGIKTDNLQLHLTAQNGLVELKDVTGQTLNGRFHASATIDARGKEPILHFKKNLDQIQIEPALQALADSSLFAGLIFFNGDLTTRGNSVDAWTRNLSGKSQFKLDEGLMRGINLTELAFEKMGALGSIAQTFLSEETKQKAPPAFRKESEIKELLASVVFENGKAKTDKLDLDMDGANANGSASFDLVEQTLVFDLNLKLSESLSNQYISQMAWPISCKGTLSAAPSCKVDSKPVRRAIEKLAKKRAERRAKEALAKKLQERTGIDLGGQPIEKAAKKEAKKQLKSKEDELKDNVQDKLQQKLNERFKKFF